MNDPVRPPPEPLAELAGQLARDHGLPDERHHEIDDLIDHLHAAVGLMSEAQQRAFARYLANYYDLDDNSG